MLKSLQTAAQAQVDGCESEKICNVTSFRTSPKFRQRSKWILTVTTQQNCSAECDGGRKVVWKPSRSTQELPGWFNRLSFAANCCAAVRADAVLEVSQFMWQPFPTVVHAAVKTKKKIWQTQFVESQRSFGRRTQTDVALASQPAGASELWASSHPQHVAEGLVSPAGPVSDETLTSSWCRMASHPGLKRICKRTEELYADNFSCLNNFLQSSRNL